MWNSDCGSLKNLPSLKVCELALRQLNNARLKGAGHCPGTDHCPRGA